MCKHLLHLVEMSCSLACLLVSQAASFHNDCSRPPVAGSRCDEYSHGTARPVFCRAGGLLERLPSAKHSARCWDHNHRWIMPHVAAYGILAVQALFFFLGGRSGSAAITVRRLADFYMHRYPRQLHDGQSDHAR